MKKNEINRFIDEMEEIGDVWEFEDVKRVYKDCSLEDALKSRKEEVGTFIGIIGRVFGR